MKCLLIYPDVMKTSRISAPKTAAAVARRSHSGCLATEASLFWSCLITFPVIMSSVSTVTSRLPAQNRRGSISSSASDILKRTDPGGFLWRRFIRQKVPVWAQPARPFFDRALYFSLRQCHQTLHRRTKLLTAIQIKEGGSTWFWETDIN